MSRFRMLLFAVIGILMSGMSVFAQTVAEPGDNASSVSKYRALAADIGFGIAVIGGAIGQSRGGAAACGGAAGNPGGAGRWGGGCCCVRGGWWWWGWRGGRQKKAFPSGGGGSSLPRPFLLGTDYK